MRSLSREEVRSLDRYAIETLGIPGVVLMENAGRGVADAVERYLGGAAGEAIAVVAGGGNNGGDGYVAARHLAIRGAKVATFLTGPPEKIAGDALTNLRIIQRLGHDIRELNPSVAEKLSAELRQFAIIVDAVAGTGVRGELRDNLPSVVQQINAARRPVVAVDIPTGLDCDTGLARGAAIRAAITVTFVARKKGFDNPQSREYTGKVIVADIGVPGRLVGRAVAGKR